MITPKETPPREALERIARQYRERGYDVKVEPRDRDLPPFLQEQTPDLIAQRDGEFLVIEVKSSPRDVDPAQLQRLSEAISREPGWRFVVVAIDRDPPPALDKLTALDERKIHARVHEVTQLLDAKHFDAAMMLAWANVEASLRLLATRHGLPLSRDNSASLIRTLATEGYLGEGEFYQLQQGLSLRARVAHGLDTISSELQVKMAVDGLTRVTETVLGELHEPA